MMREAYAGRFHYILYFQQPGLAEAELDDDIGRSLRLLLGGLGDALLAADKPADARLFDGMPDDLPLPPWCSEAMFAHYLRTFERHGFRGALNWYRNFERNWQRSEHLACLQITQPTLFLLGRMTRWAASRHRRSSAWATRCRTWNATTCPTQATGCRPNAASGSAPCCWTSSHETTSNGDMDSGLGCFPGIR